MGSPRPRVVPLSAGTASTRTIRVRGFTVIDARFNAGLRIPLHTHETACVTVVVEGEFNERLLRQGRACSRGSVLAKPPLEPHDDAFGRSGSHQLIIELGEAALNETFDGRQPWDTVVHARSVEAEVMARALLREMELADPASSLAIEGLTLELLAQAWRLCQGPTRRPPPTWLATARDLLHDRFHDSITVAGVAAAVGVHPTHLTRVFRAHHGESVGQYVRRLRVEWAKTRLLISTDPLASIAVEAGFTDQAHFTRWFKQQTGVTPHRYRTAAVRA